MHIRFRLLSLLAPLALSCSQGSTRGLPPPAPGFEPFAFVNYETSQVHPLDLTPDGRLLLVVNTADHALLLFDATVDPPEAVGRVPVGLEPVSVRARSADEAWVVNHLSDSVSVVDLRRRQVTAIVSTDDEPCDVVFAGSPERAFVTCSQVNRLLVFDPDDPRTPERIPLRGEEPRALAVSPDGRTVHVAFFESGNGTTILAGGKNDPGRLPDVVSAPAGPYGGIDVPPNRRALLDPPLAPGLPPPAPASMIVRKDGAGRWLDDNAGDWTRLVSGDLAPVFSFRVEGWDMPDRDIAHVDADLLTVTYQTRLMNLCMALDARPGTGELLVVGTDATNEIRYRTNLQGRFLRVQGALVVPGGAAAVHDLNPHLDYTQVRIPRAERVRAVGDPRGVAWREDGSEALVTGMGSRNVVVMGADGGRRGLIEVGEGPTGIVVRGGRGYVLNRFDGSLSILDLDARLEVARVAFFDPTPDAIRRGRRHLYDTHATSGLGHISCASCHVDGRTDRLAWDLGDPSGAMQTIGGVVYHPMKGPMKTTTLQDVVGVPAMHHIGDRKSIFDFAGTFEDLQGADAPLDHDALVELETYLATIHYPPNPNRSIDNGLRTDVPIPGATGEPRGFGDARAGLASFLTGVDTSSTCATCHGNARTRSDVIVVDGNDVIAGQPLIASNLRGLYDRVGLFYESAESFAGFGYRPDGSQAAEMTRRPSSFDLGTQSGSHVYAFLLSIDGPLSELPGDARDSHAGVGQQLWLGTATATEARRRIAIADRGEVGLIASGVVGGELRGYVYVGGGRFESDRAGESVSLESLLAGEAIALTLVPRGSEERLGVDADGDGVRDGDALLLLSPREFESVADAPLQIDLVARHHAGAPVTFDAIGLPTGLVLSPGGRVTGVPSAPGDYAPTLLLRAGDRDFRTLAVRWRIRAR